MFNWTVKSFDHAAWDAVRKTIQDDEYTTEYSDYFGCIICGAVCFDLVLRDCGGNEYLFCADPYLLGIDSGYGYTKDGTPYDEHCDQLALNYNVNDSFDEALASFIRQIDEMTTVDKALAEYANKTDVTWKDHD